MGTSATKCDLNLPLKLAIVGSLKSQGEIARRAGIGEVRLSKIVTRRITPTDREMEKIAKALHRTQSELFQMAVSA